MKPKKHKKYYPETEKIWYEEYLIGSKLHREGGPAIARYCFKGKVRYEYYYIDGKQHREDGPAYIYYDDSGNILQEHYYIDGKMLSDGEWADYQLYK